MFSAKSSLRSWRPFAKTLKLVVWAFSLNFLHDSTLFVIDIHRNMPISLSLTPFDYFQIRPTFAVTPNLILEPCRIYILWFQPRQPGSKGWGGQGWAQQRGERRGWSRPTEGCSATPHHTAQPDQPASLRRKHLKNREIAIAKRRRNVTGQEGR